MTTILYTFAIMMSLHAASPEDMLPNGGFESGTWDNWTLEGEAFGAVPASGSLRPGWEKWEGVYYANSWSSEDMFRATGLLRSAPFQLTQGAVTCLVSGWGSPKCYVRLLLSSDGRELDRTSAPSKGDLRFYPAELWAPEYTGQEVYVEIVDSGMDRDDWICVDSFRQTVCDMAPMARAVDITGGWRAGDAYAPGIQVSEPPLAPGATLAFSQRLHMPAGTHELVIRYESILDATPGQALGGRYAGFDGFTVNGETRSLDFIVDPGNPAVHTARIQIELAQAGTIELALRLASTRVPQTTVILQEPAPAGAFAGVAPAGLYTLAMVHGVPFVVPGLDWFRPPLLSIGAYHNGLIRDGEQARFDCQGAKADRVYFLGMIHSQDFANGSWYSKKGDHGFSHFVGDRAGDIVIEWVDGGETVVPIVFGFNLWWSRPWDMLWNYNWGSPASGRNMDSLLFGGDPAPREAIAQGVALADGVRRMGSESCNSRYIFTLDTGGRGIKAITLRGAEDMHDTPLIAGITLETSHTAPGLTPLPALAPEPSNLRPVALADATPEAIAARVSPIMHWLYTFTDDLPKLSAPEIPKGYFGPVYDFRGNDDALYSATFLYRNGAESASHIADTGIPCTSPVAPGKICQYMDGIGVWWIDPLFFGSMENWFKLYQEREPGELPGVGAGWTRGVAPLFREAMAFGYDKFLETYLNWLDNALLTEANPPHWNRVAGGASDTYEIKVGDITERGNRENDGHGMCMWGRYMVYHWLGHPKEWAERRWKVTAAAVEWIQWQLDTDQIRPGVEKDVLFTESECAHSSYDIYSSYNCLHGLKLSIRMARELRKTDEVDRWTALYEQLRQGILDNLVDEEPGFGPIWHTDPHCDWQDHAHKLPHIQLASDGDTFTPLQDYAKGDDTDRRYLEISRNTYRYLMKEKNYNCLRMYGYGQAYMLQAALLLDEMTDAEQFLSMLVHHAYLPRLGGWACPEGIILHKSGEYYLPVNGYWGQDVHLGESTKALRLLLGVDDNDATHTRFTPRFPASWNDMAVDRFPVLTGASRQLCGYRYTRSETEDVFAYHFEREPTAVDVRLGPWPLDKVITNVSVNGADVPFEMNNSGDSRWVWVRGLTGIQGEVKAR